MAKPEGELRLQNLFIDAIHRPSSEHLPISQDQYNTGYNLTPQQTIVAALIEIKNQLELRTLEEAYTTCYIGEVSAPVNKQNLKEFYLDTVNNALETVKGGKPAFLIISDGNHITVVTLIPERSGKFSVKYMNPSQGSYENTGKDLAKALCEHLVDVEKDNFVKESGKEPYKDISQPQQYDDCCGLSAALNIATIVKQCQEGQTVFTLQSRNYTKPHDKYWGGYYKQMGKRIFKTIQDRNFSSEEMLILISKKLNDRNYTIKDIQALLKKHDDQRLTTLADRALDKIKEEVNKGQTSDLAKIEIREILEVHSNLRESQDEAYRGKPFLDNIHQQYNTNYQLNNNQVQAAALIEISTRLGISPEEASRKYNITSVNSSINADKNYNAFKMQHEKQVNRYIQDAIKGKPSFLIVAGEGHFSVIAFIPKGGGKFSVQYMNTYNQNTLGKDLASTICYHCSTTFPQQFVRGPNENGCTYKTIYEQHKQCCGLSAAAHIAHEVEKSYKSSTNTEKPTDLQRFYQGMGRRIFRQIMEDDPITSIVQSKQIAQSSTVSQQSPQPVTYSAKAAPHTRSSTSLQTQPTTNIAIPSHHTPLSQAPFTASYQNTTGLGSLIPSPPPPHLSMKDLFTTISETVKKQITSKSKPTVTPPQSDRQVLKGSFAPIIAQHNEIYNSIPSEGRNISGAASEQFKDLNKQISQLGETVKGRTTIEEPSSANSTEALSTSKFSLGSDNSEFSIFRVVETNTTTKKQTFNPYNIDVENILKAVKNSNPPKDINISIARVDDNGEPMENCRDNIMISHKGEVTWIPGKGDHQGIGKSQINQSDQDKLLKYMKRSATQEQASVLSFS